MNSLHVKDLRAFLAAQAARAPLLLDVREDWEVAQAPLNVPEAPTVHVPMNRVPAQRAEWDPARPVVCFCHHGMRSAQVVAFLLHHGHAEVYNLTGGTDAWSTQVDPGVARY